MEKLKENRSFAESSTGSSRSEMRTPEDVAAMLRLHELGWGSKRIARELGVSRNTVRRYVRQGGYAPYATPRRRGRLDGLEDWLRERLVRHRGNADVVRQELASEHSIEVSLRTVERAVAPYRRELAAQARATTRFETAPGRQLQIDFGQMQVCVAGIGVRVYLFVATLGFSRRLHVQAFRDERQASWLAGLEGAFTRFGGVPFEVLVDNARALVTRHDPVTREVEFNTRFHAFAKHWGFTPVACAPYRARTKGKDERSVRYVKENAVAGREFVSWEHFEGWLDEWSRTIADERVHGTTGEVPRVRFDREEASALQPLGTQPSFVAVRELSRTVHSDFCVELDTNWYSVPWRLIGNDVTVRVWNDQVEVFYAGGCVARHRQATGRRQRVIDPAHFEGVTRMPSRDVPAKPPISDDLTRDLDVYEAAVAEVA